MDLENLAVKIAREFDMDVYESIAKSTVVELAKLNSYSPVKEYLEEKSAAPVDPTVLDNIASDYFGTKESIYNVYMKKTILNAVARVYNPGCQVDSACVLQGKQGINKSSFWRTLAVKDAWFDDTIASGSSDKDERLKLRAFWFLELAEIDNVFRKKEVAALRGFMTTRQDNIRVPYGRTIQSFPRTSVFVGSVNPSEFLVDTEGNRRFWPIPVRVPHIDIDRLRRERDTIWAAAVQLYKAQLGTPYLNWLSPEEEAASVQLKSDHEVADIWLEYISNFVANRNRVTVAEVLIDCLQIDLVRHDKHSQMRVTDCLKQLGFVRGKQVSIDGIRAYPWSRATSPTSDQGGEGGVKEGGEGGQNPCPISNPANSTSPTSPLEPKHSRDDSYTIGTHRAEVLSGDEHTVRNVSHEHSASVQNTVLPEEFEKGEGGEVDSPQSYTQTGLEAPTSPILAQGGEGGSGNKFCTFSISDESEVGTPIRVRELSSNLELELVGINASWTYVVVRQPGVAESEDFLAIENLETVATGVNLVKVNHSVVLNSIPAGMYLGKMVRVLESGSTHTVAVVQEDTVVLDNRIPLHIDQVEVV
jgi:predicted P-loop ATPase